MTHWPRGWMVRQRYLLITLLSTPSLAVSTSRFLVDLTPRCAAWAGSFNARRAFLTQQALPTQVRIANGGPVSARHDDGTTSGATPKATDRSPTRRVKLVAWQ